MHNQKAQRQLKLFSSMSSRLEFCLVFFQFTLSCCIVLISVRTGSIFALAFPSATNTTDPIALLAFKSTIVHDPQEALSSWNESLHFCEWEGIQCGRRHQRVTVLNLSSRGLVGFLSPHIGNLSFLREIYLQNNTLQGEVPNELGKLFRLQKLHLANNSLVGNIPANLSHCTNLNYLNLGRNNLVGKIPCELQSLPNLKNFGVHWNNLVGGIPPFLGNFTSLEKLSMAYNPLGGSIPDDLGRLKKLIALGLGGNNLSGMIPPSIYNLSSIAVFSVSQNRLHGTLPQDLGLKLPHLQILELTQNFFSGSIPASLSNASQLESIEVYQNGFSGKLSVDFGSMLQLWYLNLGFNDLGSGEPDEMSFLTSLANCSNLESLTLGVNHFKAVLPNSLGNLSTRLERLTINSNQLYGAIPSGIGNLVSLYLLGMEYNQFTGVIPEEFGNLQNLQWTALNHNRLSGRIPSSLGNLTGLTELHLQNNKLQGTIPPSFAQFQRLIILDLSKNELSGSIPRQIFDISSLSILLNLSSNHFVGSIPSNVGNLKNIMELDVSENSLSGEIPRDLISCTHLETLNMQGNLFDGVIPQSLSSLRGIQRFDISHNKLSGKIPKFFQILAMEYLNLSFNDFEGEVPSNGVFANGSAISIIGNKKLCGGIPKLGLPKCPIKESKQQSRVWKILIWLACALVGSMVLSCLIFWKFRMRSVGHPFVAALRKELVQVSYTDVLQATDGFSPDNLIGEGSFGSVYKGILDKLGGEFVAFKILRLHVEKAAKSFLAECNALTTVRHRNLVKVITCCSSVDYQGNDFKALVYEFMPNGSLESWLHPLEDDYRQVESQNLGLLWRINIAIDVASALDYLHHQSPTIIVHCDLKPANILLDREMTAHIGDFGLVRFLSELPVANQSSSIGVRGTIGYAAPEYGLGSQVSTYGDVYSYGIVLLEMMTGKRPTDAVFEGDLNLHSHARMALTDQVMAIVDPSLLNHEIEDPVHSHRQRRDCGNDTQKLCLESLVRIGVACSMESPQERMDIKEVIHELQQIKKMLLRSGRIG